MQIHHFAVIVLPILSVQYFGRMVYLQKSSYSENNNVEGIIKITGNDIFHSTLINLTKISIRKLSV